MELRKDVGNEFDLANRRMEVAREDLETAQANLEANHYRAANNRAYYKYLPFYNSSICIGKSSI